MQLLKSSLYYYKYSTLQLFITIIINRHVVNLNITPPIQNQAEAYYFHRSPYSTPNTEHLLRLMPFQPIFF